MIVAAAKVVAQRRKERFSAGPMSPPATADAETMLRLEEMADESDVGAAPGFATAGAATFARSIGIALLRVQRRRRETLARRGISHRREAGSRRHDGDAPPEGELEIAIRIPGVS